MHAPPARVFILDDDDAARAASLMKLSGLPSIEVVGDGAATFSTIPRLADGSVDIVILNLDFPGVAGVELCREIRMRCPDIACLVMTASADEGFLVDAIIAGASGYVLRDEPGPVIAEAISDIAQGRAVIDPTVTQRVLERMQVKDPFAALTAQERRILGRVAEGWTNKEIAEELSLAEQTVKNYVGSILSKLGLERRAQIVAFAVRREPPDS